MADDYADRLQHIAVILRLQADGKMFHALTGAMKDGVEPAKAKIRDGIPGNLPRRGGYAATVAADLDLPVTVTAAGRNPGVSIRARTLSGEKRRFKRLDGGVLAHPVFGDRSDWKEQTKGVRAGFFTRPCREAAPDVERNLDAALDRVAAEIDQAG